MKCICVLLTAICFGFVLKVAAHPITLNAGESFNYQFDNLPLVGISDHYSGATPQGWLFWNAEPLIKNTLLEVTMFENSLDEEALYSWVVTNPTLSGGLTLSEPVFPNVWQDLQGAFSFRVITGAAVINSVEVKSLIPHQPGGLFADVYGFANVLVVPEPSPGIIFLALLVGVAFIRHQRH